MENISISASYGTHQKIAFNGSTTTSRHRENDEAARIHHACGREYHMPVRCADEASIFPNPTSTPTLHPLGIKLPLRQVMPDSLGDAAAMRQVADWFENLGLGQYAQR
jgi:hypothetical protein